MDQLVTGYLNQGVLGLTILACIFVIIYQARKIDALQKDIKDALLLRLQDSKDYNNSYSTTVEKYAVLSEKGLQSDTMVMQAINGIASLLQNKQ